jgi:hypothetical protein
LGWHLARSGQACWTSKSRTAGSVAHVIHIPARIEDALETANIQYDRLDGTMKREERSRAMDALKHDPSCEVLLVSLKAGGVGLNLTAAQRVYLMDPYWYDSTRCPRMMQCLTS